MEANRGYVLACSGGGLEDPQLPFGFSGLFFTPSILLSHLRTKGLTNVNVEQKDRKNLEYMLI